MIALWMRRGGGDVGPRALRGSRAPAAGTAVGIPLSIHTQPTSAGGHVWRGEELRKEAAFELAPGAVPGERRSMRICCTLYMYTRVRMDV